MRVAIIDQVGGVGGLARFLEGLTTSLLRAPQADDWEFSLVLRRIEPWALRLDDPRLQLDIMPPAKPLLQVRGARRARRVLWRLRHRSGQPPDPEGQAYRRWTETWARARHLDLAYFTSPFGMPCPQLNAPMLTTFHDFNHRRFDSWPPQVRTQIGHEILGWLERSSVAIVSSSFIAGELRTFHPDYADRLRVIRLGIPTRPRRARPAEWTSFRARHRLPDRFLLTVGFISAHKNQKVILEALALLKREGLGAPLVCVGPNSQHLKGPRNQPSKGYTDAVLAVADRQGLRYGADFFGLGQVSDVELQMLYERADALVMPTLYEAGSFPVREALRAGCPVVCSNIPPLREDLDVARAQAWLFDPNDPADVATALRLVLADPVAARQQVQPFRKLVEDAFDWRQTAVGYATTFADVLSNQGRAGSVPHSAAIAAGLPGS